MSAFSDVNRLEMEFQHSADGHRHGDITSLWHNCLFICAMMTEIYSKGGSLAWAYTSLLPNDLKPLVHTHQITINTLIWHTPKRIFSHVCGHDRPASCQVLSQRSAPAGKDPKPSWNQKRHWGWHARYHNSVGLFGADTRSALGPLVETVDSRSRRSLARHPARCTALEPERTGDLISYLEIGVKRIILI